MHGNETHTFGDWTVTVVVSDPPFFENGYVITHRPSGESAAIDPGAPASRFTAHAEAHGGALTGILLTHGHPDHVSGVAELRRVIGGTCRVHEAEKPVIELGPALAGALMMPDFEEVGDCDWFDSARDLVLGGLPIGLIEAPGHSPGGVVYVFDGFAFTGDTLFAQGVGRTDLPGGDPPALGRSIDRLLTELPGDCRLFSGHGPAWTVDEARPWWQWAKAAYGLG